MITILTACTGRKHAGSDGLRLRDVEKGPLDAVARAWLARVNAAEPVRSADALYAGRDYRRLAAQCAPERPYIVSAGLGLLHPETLIPSYDATVAAGVEDSVYSRATGRFTPRDWFLHLQARSRYATPARDLPATGLILAALPARYLGMIADDLVRLGPARLRLFTGSDRAVPGPLQACRMPYDGLLADVPGYNGPLVGFAERALSHFIAEILPILPEGDCVGHHTAVRDALRRPRR